MFDRPALIQGFLSFVLVVLGGQSLRAQSIDSKPARGDAALAKLAQKYSLKVVVTDLHFPVKLTGFGSIDGSEAVGKERDSFVPILTSEWFLYPVELVEKTRLRRIILCKNLTFEGQRRTAVPDFEHHDLYFDVVRGSYSELYVRKVIHHEFFHIIDFMDDGQLYSDERWAALNPKGFKYGAGGSTAQKDSSMSLVNNRVAGFLNKYSTMGVEEDKAEVFANMVVNPNVMELRAKQDKVIKAKMRRMTELLEAFSPETDKTFWERAHQLKRPIK